MGIEFFIPATLCVTLGVVAFICYLAYCRRITRYLAGMLSGVILVSSVSVCWVSYSRMKELASRPLEQVAAESFGPAMQSSGVSSARQQGTRTQKHNARVSGQTAKSITDAAAIHPASALSYLSGRTVKVHDAYLVAEEDFPDGRIYVFSSNPGGRLSQGNNVLFFCVAADKDTEAKANAIPKNTACVFTAEFKGLRELGKEEGVNINALVAEMKDVFLK